MFDLISQAFHNLDQAGLLIAGAACLVLGGLVAVSTFRWRRRGSRIRYAFDIAGWVLVVVGGGLLYVAFSLRPVTVGTWLMLGLLAAYLAVKVLQAWKPETNGGSLTGWRAETAKRLERWANVPIVPIEDIVTDPTNARQRKVNRLWGPALLAAGFGLFGLGIYLALEPPAAAAGAWSWLAPIGVLVIGTFFSWTGVRMTRQGYMRLG